MADDLRLLPLLPRTQHSYLACVRQLGEHFHKAPEEATPEELRQYFLYLKTERRLTRSSSTQAICAIKMFWENLRQLQVNLGHKSPTATVR